MISHMNRITVPLLTLMFPPPTAAPGLGAIVAAASGYGA
jgi:hypothetical protein